MRTWRRTLAFAIAAFAMVAMIDDAFGQSRSRGRRGVARKDERTGIPSSAASAHDVKTNGRSVLNDAGRRFSDRIKVEYGEGFGETSEEAVKEALRDVLQKVVGVYVDSDFRMNSDAIIKDEVITHSNGIVERYEKINERLAADGRGVVVTIKAWVKMQDFFSRMNKVGTKGVVLDGDLLSVDVGNRLNGEALLRKELESTSLTSLLEVTVLNGRRSSIICSSDETVTLGYVFKVGFSKKRYGMFVDRLSRVLDQITSVRRRERTLAFYVEKADAERFYDVNVASGYRLRPANGNSMFGTFGTSDRGRLRIVSGVNNGGRVVNVREWTLESHQKRVFDDWHGLEWEMESVDCVLLLKSSTGDALAVGRASVNWRCSARFRDTIAPFCGSLSGFRDCVVGGIAVEIAREDVARVHEIEISLESNENE